MAASAMAGRITDGDLRKRVTQRKKEIDDLKKQVDLAEMARARLKSDPDNVKANLALGRSLCFNKGEWDEGLPLLAKGDDEKLKNAATKEIAKPTEAVAQEEIANLWFALAANANSADKLAMLDHAKEFYETAVRDLPALAKLRVEKRISEIDKQLQGTPTPSPLKTVRKPKDSNVASASKRTSTRSNSAPPLSSPPTNNGPAPFCSNMPDDPNAVAALQQRNISMSRRNNIVTGILINSPNISGADLKTVFDQLKGLPNLEEVSILNSTLPEGTFKALALVKPNLLRLQLLSVSMPDADIKDLAEFKELESLQLFASRPLSSPCKHLVLLKNLRHLNLMVSTFQDSDFESISALRLLTRLEIRSGKFSGDGLKHISGFTQLEHLYLQRDIEPSSLQYLKNLTKLQYLDIPRNTTDADFAHLKGMTSLERLDLSGTRITDVSLAQVKNCLRLRDLTLPEEITDAGMRRLETLSNLQTLNLQATKVTDRGLRSLRNLTALNQLHLPSSVINCSEIANHTSLTTLHISAEAIANDALMSLKGLPRLRFLGIYGSQSLGTGLKHAKQLPVLDQISFQCPGVNEDALKHIGAVNSLRTIHFLNGAPLTDAGFAHTKIMREFATCLDTIE